MARYLVDFGLFDPKRRHTSQADSRIEVARIRDAFRSTLDPDSLQTNWQVTDIFAWSATGTEAYGFLVYQMDGGAPSSRVGPAFLFMWPGFGGFVAQEFDQYTSANRSTYFRSATNSTFFSSDGAMAMHYNPDAVLDPYDVGDASDGTLTSGDFTAPTTSPNTDIDTFMPSGTVYGVASSSSLGMTENMTQGSRCIFVFDDQKPFCSMYYTNDDHLYTSGIWTLGDIVVPYRSADTNTSATFFHELTSQGTLGTNTYWYCLDDGGAIIETDAVYSETFTRDNTPFADGTFPWDVVVLATSTYYKGFINSDVIRVMGPVDNRYLSQFDNGQFLKASRVLCYPYSPNEPSFVYPDPTDVS